jgi:hypothetical protein
MPHRYLVEFEGRTLDLESLSFEDWLAQIKRAFGGGYGPSQIDPAMVRAFESFLRFRDYPGSRAWDLIRHYINDCQKFAKFWLDEGHKILVDAGGTVVPQGEPQYIILKRETIQNWEQLQ